MKTRGEDYYRQCYATRLILGFVMRQRLERVRERDDTNGLGPVDADKTMRLTDRLWASRPGIAERAKGQLGFLPIDRDIYGKHGHRPGFETGGPSNLPALDAIVAYDQNVTPANRLLVVHERISTWGVVKYYESQVSAARLEPLVVSGLILRADIAYLEALGHALGVLTEDEIVAIGRHDGEAETVNAILWEIDRWSRATAIALATLETLNSASTTEELKAAAHAAWSSVSLAYESMWKCGISDDAYGSDREAYATGLPKLTQASLDSEIQHCCSCLVPADTIWESAAIRDLQMAVFATWTISLCILRLRLMPPFAGTELTQRFEGVTDARLERALDDVVRLTGMDTDLQPTRFTYSSFSKIPCTSVAEVPRHTPSLDELSQWVQKTRAIASAIEQRLIAPKLADRDLQQA